MNIALLVLTRAAVLGVTVLALEGANLMSGGDMYLASLSQLAQSGGTPPPPPPPPPPLPQGEGGSGSGSNMLPPPPPQEGGIGGSTNKKHEPPSPPPPPQGQQHSPVLTPKSSGFQPPSPPPPPEKNKGTMKNGELMESKGNKDKDSKDSRFNNDNSDRNDNGEHSNFFKGQEKEEEESEEDFGQEDFIDPREISDTLKQIKDLKRQISQLIKQAQRAKIANGTLDGLNKVSSDLDRIKNVLSSSDDVGEQRDALQEFRDGQYWDEVNKARAVIEVPKQIKEIENSLKRLKRVISQKAAKNLGLDLNRVQFDITKMEANIANVKGMLASGDLEGINEQMQEFWEGGHPGEIEGVITAVRDLRNMMKRSRNSEAVANAEQVLQEVTALFNAGDYREARELLDESRNTIFRSLQQQNRRNSGSLLKFFGH